MGVQERKAREKQELRQEILDAARALFVEQGYEAVSMRRIADRIEYSPTTIYLYFRDKAELFDCLCTETFEKLIRELETTAHTDPVEGFRAGLRRYIEFGTAHPDHYRVTFMTPLKGECPGGGRNRTDPGERAFACLKSSLTACVCAGRFRVADVDAVSLGIWAAVHGVTALLITHGEFPWIDREALIATVIETIAAGLEPDEA